MFSLKIEEDPSLANFVDSNKALKKVLSGEYMVCTLCKEQDKNLGACLRKRKLLIGKPSNGTTHLKEHSPLQHSCGARKQSEGHQNLGG